MKRAQPVVAIDGPAGSGKSTVARRLAQALGFTLVDTGAMYRCVALAADQVGIGWDDADALGELAGRLRVRFERGGLGERIWLDDREVTQAIRVPHISQGSSRVSAHPQVRAALLQLQRDLGRAGGVVLEGRDIGTVVFPDAEVKVFLSASARVRAERRSQELAGRQVAAGFEETLAEVIERDQRDQTRAVAPLKPAADARSIDSGPLSIDEVVGLIRQMVVEQGRGDPEGKAMDP